MIPDNLTPDQHDQVMKRLNPEGWTTEQWVEFNELMMSSHSYSAYIQELHLQRHEWAAKKTFDEVGGKPVASNVMKEIRLDYNEAARVRFPNFCPLKWQMGERPNNLGEVMGSAQRRKNERLRKRIAEVGR